AGWRAGARRAQEHRRAGPFAARCTDRRAVDVPCGRAAREHLGMGAWGDLLHAAGQIGTFPHSKSDLAIGPILSYDNRMNRLVLMALSFSGLACAQGGPLSSGLRS